MKRAFLFSFMGLLAAVLFFVRPAIAQDDTQAQGGSDAATSTTDQPACFAAIIGIVGSCQTLAKGASDDAWATATLNQCLNVGDKVRTLDDGKLALKYGDSVQMRLNASSTLVIAQQEGSENPDEIDLNMGELYTELDKEKQPDSKFRVVTPAGVMAVRGTKFNVAIDAEGKSKVNVLEGMVGVFNDLGEVLAEAGKATEILKGVLPATPFDFNVEEFQNKLNEWKDKISVGKVLEAAKEKVNEQIDKATDSVPVPNKLKKKLKF